MTAPDRPDLAGPVPLTPASFELVRALADLVEVLDAEDVQLHEARWRSYPLYGVHLEVDVDGDESVLDRIHRKVLRLDAVGEGLPTYVSESRTHVRCVGEWITPRQDLWEAPIAKVVFSVRRTAQQCACGRACDHQQLHAVGSTPASAAALSSSADLTDPAAPHAEACS